MHAGADAACKNQCFEALYTTTKSYTHNDSINNHIDMYIGFTLGHPLLLHFHRLCAVQLQQQRGDVHVVVKREQLELQHHVSVLLVMANGNNMQHLFRSILLGQELYEVAHVEAHNVHHALDLVHVVRRDLPHGVMA